MSKKNSRSILNSPIFLTGVIIILLAVLLFGIATLCIGIKLSVDGGAEPVELVYNKDITTYVPPAAVASANGERLDVKVSGSVDPTRLGTYVITYRAQYLWVWKTVKKEIRVVDKTAPVITLNKVPGYMTPPGEEYQEEGYSAVDDYDGDITAKVQSHIENDMVYYTVEDSSGNKTTVQREIIHKDEISPVIALKGEKSITISAGTAFVEPGYTALDNIDGDITAKVEISGSVNIYRADTYTVTYSAKDSSGNVGTATRTVIVKPIQQPPVVKPNGKVIYLTFDDGPSKYTQRLLDILAAYDAKATFFVVNTNYKMDVLFNAIVDGGHGLGIHTKTHKYEEIYASEEAFFNDLYAMQQIIKKHTGKITTLMRFPGGSSNVVSAVSMKLLTEAVTDQGFQYFDWHIDSQDWRLAASSDYTNEEKAAQVANTIIAGIEKEQKNGREKIVVLQHDLYSYSVEAVEQVLIWGIQNGYTFQALTPNSPACHHSVRN